MIAEGKYNNILIDDVEFGESQNGNEMVTITFKLEDGQTVLYMGAFSDAAAEYTLEALRCAGLESDDVFDALKLKGQRVHQIVVRHETYEGKTNARVRFINAKGGFKPLDDNRKTSLRARMKAKLAATATKEKGGDDVPFTV